jgi:diaminopimelate decarboxylase
MVDAGFCDLVRPAMYGAYHHISIVGKGAGRAPEPLVVAGPLCESGDVFTRDEHELLDPRPSAPARHRRPARASRCGSLRRGHELELRVPRPRSDCPLGQRATPTLIARRETVEDLVRTECEEPLP